MRTLLRGGVLAAVPGSALAIEDGLIVFSGSDDRAAAFDQADEIIELDGSLVAPAFVDAHVHTVQAGFRLTHLDLHGSPSRTDALHRLGAYAAAKPEDAVIVGQGWDETIWPDATLPSGAELHRAAGGRRVALTRIDGHSALVSPALAAAVPGLEHQVGFDADGRVERAAHHAVRDVLGDLIGPGQRLAAAREAAAEMKRQGIAAFHENAAPHIGPEYEIDLVRQVAEESGLRGTIYWGELNAIEKARRLGAQGLAGDLVADGALGSRTAALRSAYDDTDSCGHAYLSAHQVADHVVLCTEAGLQAGFHCIGEAALDAVAEGFVRAAERLGDHRIAGARHRLEHVEMPSPDVLAILARLQVIASVQPVFDALWGGPHQMYAERVGDRWRDMNPFLALEMGSGGLAFGSDSPVTPIGPWAAVRAAVHHHNPEHRLPVGFAFRAHTRGGRKAGRDDAAGTLVRGSRADLAVWDVPGGLMDGWPSLVPDAPLPRLRRLLAAGRTIHDSEETP